MGCRPTVRPASRPAAPRARARVQPASREIIWGNLRMWDLVRSSEIVWDLVRSSVIMQDHARSCEFVWDHVRSCEIMWDQVKSYEIMRDPSPPPNNLLSTRQGSIVGCSSFNISIFQFLRTFPALTRHSTWATWQVSSIDGTKPHSPPTSTDFLPTPKK